MKDLSMKMNNISLPVLLKLMIEGGGFTLVMETGKLPVIPYSDLTELRAFSVPLFLLGIQTIQVQ